MPIHRAMHCYTVLCTSCDWCESIALRTIAPTAQHRQRPALSTTSTHRHHMVSGQIGSTVARPAPPRAPVPMHHTPPGHSISTTLLLGLADPRPAFALGLELRPLHWPGTACTPCASCQCTAAEA